MRITKEEYERLKRYEEQYEKLTQFILDSPSRFIEFQVWLVNQLIEVS